MSPTAKVAGASAVAGAGAYAAGQRFAKKARVLASAANPSPGFNPGGAGGFKTTLKKKRKSRKQRNKAKAKAKFRKAVMEAVHFRKICDFRDDWIFPVQTSQAFDGVVPLVGPYDATTRNLTTAGLCPKGVGWNLVESPTSANLRAELGGRAMGVINMPWSADADNSLRRFEFADPDTEANNAQYEIERKIKWLLEFRNSSNVGAKVNVYLMRCIGNCTSDAYTELRLMRNYAYVEGTSAISGSPPPNIARDFEQYMKVRLNGRKRMWKIEQEFEMQLNPGDTARQTMSLESRMPYLSNVSTEYEKGCWQIIMRIEGSLIIDATDPSQYDYSGAVVGVHMTRAMKVAINRKEWDVVHRISAVTSGTVTDGVTAGDADVHAVSM